MLIWHLDSPMLLPCQRHAHPTAHRRQVKSLAPLAAVKQGVKVCTGLLSECTGL